MIKRGVKQPAIYLMSKPWSEGREGGRNEGREGGRNEGREGGRNEGREGGRE